jgi:hypothetical protein
MDSTISFLFEQILIFSETVGKKTQFTSPVYVYKAHFLVSGGGENDLAYSTD